MALRREDLVTAPDAVVVDFPVRIAAARRRRAHRQVIVRRMAALALTLAIVAGIVVSASDPQSAVTSRPGAPAYVVAEPGETLWDLALLYAPEGVDREAYVDRLITLNGVSGVAPPGMRLELP